MPPSVAQVETAIPVFIGYTQKALETTFPNKAVRLSSLADYEFVFGGAFNQTFTAVLAPVGAVDSLLTPPVEPTLVYRMYYAMQLYFANGGGPCYVVSVGLYDNTVVPPLLPVIDSDDLLDGLEMSRKEDEPTLILFPDAVSIVDAGGDDDSYAAHYGIYDAALAMCEELKDRFTIIDVYRGNLDFLLPGGEDVINGATNSLRSRIGTDNLKYGATYYPWLETTLNYAYDPAAVTITGFLAAGLDVNGDPNPPVAIPAATPFKLRDDADRARSMFHFNNGIYQQIKAAIEAFNIVMPPGPVMAGIYARVDSTRGVWKAPANVSVFGAIKPTVKINDKAQEDLNVHFTGKSVNAIRAFVGKGILVWGSRTLAGNDNEWRYVPVKRFFIMVEESVKKASNQFVFEPNDANTWIKVKAMIENFLLLQWRAGALAGTTPEQAFYVKVGLNETMTALDILEGRMIVEIGMAAVRPAEFIILKFSHKMQEA